MGGKESTRGLIELLERRMLLSTITSVGNFGGGSSGPPLGNLTDNNGTLLYVNNDSIYGPELWRSDGMGATMVKDIRRGADGGLVLGGGTYCGGVWCRTGERRMAYVVRDLDE